MTNFIEQNRANGIVACQEGRRDSDRVARNWSPAQPNLDPGCNQGADWHPSEEALELWVMHRSNDEMRIDEHILCCEVCLDILERLAIKVALNEELSRRYLEL